MRPRITTLALSAVSAVSLFVVACGGGADVGPEGADGELEESALRETTAAAAELTSEDGRLKISLEMFDGTKRDEKNKRFIQAVLKRDDKRVTMECFRTEARARKDGELRSNIVCRHFVPIPGSPDQHEWVEANIVRERGETRAQIYYSGGPLLKDEKAVLIGHPPQGGAGAKTVYLTVDRSPDNVEKNPLRVLDRMANVTKAMIGRTIERQYRGSPSPTLEIIKAFETRLDEKMEIKSEFEKESGDNPYTDYLDGATSILETKGDLASGTLDEAALDERLKAQHKIRD